MENYTRNKLQVVVWWEWKAEGIYCCAILWNQSFSIRISLFLPSTLPTLNYSRTPAMPNGKQHIRRKNRKFTAFFIPFRFSEQLFSPTQSLLCGCDRIKLKLFSPVFFRLHEWIKLKAFPFPVGMAVVIMCEIAHLTPNTDSNNSPTKMLPIKLISIVFLCCLLLLWL